MAPLLGHSGDGGTIDGGVWLAALGSRHIRCLPATGGSARLAWSSGGEPLPTGRRGAALASRARETMRTLLFAALVGVPR